MNSNIKVSICVITYNHENYILQTLDGILKQEYPGDIELIISIDCSPDDTENIIKQYLLKIKPPLNFEITLTNHRTNLGAVSNFSWVLQQATGKYVAFCEGDDFWTDTHKIKKHVDFMEENPDFSLCFSACSYINQQGDLLGELRYGHKNEWVEEDVLMGSFIVPLKSMLSKNLSREFVDFYEKFPNRTGGDRLYSYFYATKGRIKYFDEITATYRLHDGGIWWGLNEKEKLSANIKQHFIFLEEVSRDDSKLKRYKIIFLRKIFKELFFNFYKKPANTLSHTFYILTKYRVAYNAFFYAFKDYFSYYFSLLKAKFRFSNV